MIQHLPKPPRARYDRDVVIALAVCAISACSMIGAIVYLVVR